MSGSRFAERSIPDEKGPFFDDERGAQLIKQPAGQLRDKGFEAPPVRVRVRSGQEPEMLSSPKVRLMREWYPPRPPKAKIQTEIVETDLDGVLTAGPAVQLAEEQDR